MSARRISGRWNGPRRFPVGFGNYGFPRKFDMYIHCPLRVQYRLDGADATAEKKEAGLRPRR